jgi:D-cysteine desulfhydrase family pyridoxal phosphate-dependent enzyme
MVKMDSKVFKRVNIAHLPTPLEELRNLSEYLDGPRLFIKRDDATGLAFGGNKTRILEYIMPDILETKAEVVVTGAGLQSNWCRQTAAAARKFGIKPVLILRAGHWKKAPKRYDGNLLLDEILGADVRIVEGDVNSSDLEKIYDSVIEEYQRKGLKVHRIGWPKAGILSAIAYYDGVKEIINQAKQLDINIDKIVCAITSGGTFAGLSIGFKIFNPSTQVLAINVGSSNKNDLAERVLEYGNSALEQLESQKRISKDDFVIIDEYNCGGYGLIEPRLIEVIKKVAQLEGIILDPVYTGKAMLGIFEMIKERSLTKNETVIFLHTGGTPAVFPYKEHFQN